MSRLFTQEAEKALKEFKNRDLVNYDFVSLIIDGKSLFKQNIVHVVGITGDGKKIMLGFVHTATENSESIKGLLKGLIERNLCFNNGLLVISDGSKGISKAVEEVFG